MSTTFSGRALRVLLVAGIGALALAPTGAESASTATGTLTLTGTVAKACTFNFVTPSAGAAATATLPIDTPTAQTNLQIATVTENCNTGYTVVLRTANGLTLKGANGANTDTLAYSLTYNTTAVSSLAANTDSSALTDSNTKTPAAGTTRAISITYASPSNLSPDTYSDTVTFTISAK